MSFRDTITAKMDRKANRAPATKTGTADLPRTLPFPGIAPFPEKGDLHEDKKIKKKSGKFFKEKTEMLRVGYDPTISRCPKVLTRDF